MFFFTTLFKVTQFTGKQAGRKKIPVTVVTLMIQQYREKLLTLQLNFHLSAK